jgi:hypothetical protein
MGDGILFIGGKAAEVKKMWIYAGTPPYVFME